MERWIRASTLQRRAGTFPNPHCLNINSADGSLFLFFCLKLIVVIVPGLEGTLIFSAWIASISEKNNTKATNVAGGLEPGPYVRPLLFLIIQDKVQNLFHGVLRYEELDLLYLMYLSRALRS